MRVPLPRPSPGSPRSLAHVLASLATGALVVACGGERSAARRNVLLITLDTTRADYLSCYGVHPGVTPNLDALAAQGTRFDLAISTAGVTPVSHAAILTGLDNQEHRLRVLSADSGCRLPEGIPTLGTVFAAAGYHTVAVHSALPVSKRFGFAPGFDVFEDLDGALRPTADGNWDQWDVGTYQRRSDATTELVKKSLGSAQPFFLWIHYWDPHDWTPQFLPPAEFLPPRDEVYDRHGNVKRPGTALYAAELHYEDAQIGKLFAWLREKGLYDDTLVVVVADHGQGLMQHDWPAHHLLYQEQVHVPLLVRVPGEPQAPSVGALVRTTDIFPTILDYAGIELPQPVSGRSLRALIEGRPDEKRIAFADQINGYDRNAGVTRERPLDHFLYMTIDWPWKLIYRPLTPERSLLYNLVDDPGEARDLYAQRRDDAVRLLKRLAQARPWVSAEFAKGTASEDAASVENGLNALGYAGHDTVAAQWIWVCPEHPEQRVNDANENCPLCHEPPILRVDPACTWVCPEHRDRELGGPDERCPVPRCGKAPILIRS